jgi:hypothetical protein
MYVVLEATEVKVLSIKRKPGRDPQRTKEHLQQGKPASSSETMTDKSAADEKDEDEGEENVAEVRKSRMLYRLLRVLFGHFFLSTRVSLLIIAAGQRNSTSIKQRTEATANVTGHATVDDRERHVNECQHLIQWFCSNLN